jgi:hypothetical protein
MLRLCARVIALTAMIICLPMTAQAVDTTLTLACQGTVTVTPSIDDAKPEPISVGIILNFITHTVQGFGNPTEITRMNDTTITFAGSDPSAGWTVDGSIDRVTGEVGATTTLWNLKTKFALKCRPAQRMF